MPAELTFETVMEGRLATYAMLSRLYRKEMDADTLAKMKKMKCPINTGNTDVDTGYRLFHRYLSGTWERTLEDLDRDYVKTFIGWNTTGHSAAYPNESVHTSPDRLVMSDARDEVFAIYRAAGLKSSDNWKMGEDHISVELEYMQVETQRAMDALAKGDEEAATRELLNQYTFVTDHLLNWVPFLAKDMLAFAGTDFYRALAYLTRGFIEVDREFLKNTLASELDKRGLNDEAANAPAAEAPTDAAEGAGPGTEG